MSLWCCAQVEGSNSLTPQGFSEMHPIGLAGSTSSAEDNQGKMVRDAEEMPTASIVSLSVLREQSDEKPFCALKMLHALCRHSQHPGNTKVHLVTHQLT